MLYVVSHIGLVAFMFSVGYEFRGVPGALPDDGTVSEVPASAE